MVKKLFGIYLFSYLGVQCFRPNHKTYCQRRSDESNAVCVESANISNVALSPKVSCNINDVQKIIEKALHRAGYSQEESTITSETLIYAELRGNNQGIVKILSGALTPHPNASAITVTKETKVSAKIDGGQCIGMAVLSKAVDVAIEKAKFSGMSVIGVSNYSSATGAIGIWAKKIADQGLIGIVLSQCPELVAPYGSYEPIFGTNPIAIGIPRQPYPIVLDMATSAAAYFSLVIAQREGTAIPDNIAFDKFGNSTTDPNAALVGALRVFGDHKGGGLALMVELLAGALTGASMIDKQSSQNWGSLVIAFDPELFGTNEEFAIKVEQMVNRVKEAKKLPHVDEILLPSERGNLMEAQALSRGTLTLSEHDLKELKRLANIT